MNHGLVDTHWWALLVPAYRCKEVENHWPYSSRLVTAILQADVSPSPTWSKVGYCGFVSVHYSSGFSFSSHMITFYGEVASRQL